MTTTKASERLAATMGRSAQMGKGICDVSTSIARLATLLIALASPGCGQSIDQQNRTNRNASAPSAGAVPILQVTVDGVAYTDFQFGTLHLRVPDSTKPILAEINGKVPHLKWILLWPEMRSSNGSANSTADKGRDMGRTIIIDVGLNDSGNPDGRLQWYEIREPVEQWGARRGRNGPILNDELGLIEFRKKEPPFVGTEFFSVDPAYSNDKNARRFASCDSFPRSAGEERFCRSGTVIRAGLGAQYTFFFPLLKDWPKIDRAVRELLASIVVNPR